MRSSKTSFMKVGQGHALLKSRANSMISTSTFYTNIEEEMANEVDVQRDIVPTKAIDLEDTPKEFGFGKGKKAHVMWKAAKIAIGWLYAFLELKNFADIQHLYKSELQVYAQKRNLGFPVYSCEREGPPHASRFKCRVTIEGKTYESSEYFHTLKEAEHAAAKVALISLSPDCVQKDDSAFYKNLLHQLVQKEGLQLPAYYPNRSGEAHSPVFVSSVEIEGEHFIGEEAKTKKQAEMNAAKVAYNALKERRSSQIPLVMPSSFQGQEASKFLSSPAQSNTAANLLQHIKPTAPVQQAKDRTGEN
ncbi:Double-stranded RNA-binding protein 4 [Morus notabilis]|uniref:Double-stranded RNA-binding protein 4 n=1 Tax=Morus notabilis TaxID=981085 RepID=W9QEJ1_9ROSA|nr:Double-stranded RNA-binding protein 4 [Morus notabilis]